MGKVGDGADKGADYGMDDMKEVDKKGEEMDGKDAEYKFKKKGREKALGLI